MVLEIKEGLHASYTSTPPLTHNPSPWSFGVLLKICFIFNPLPALPFGRGKVVGSQLSPPSGGFQGPAQASRLGGKHLFSLSRLFSVQFLRIKQIQGLAFPYQ